MDINAKENLLKTLEGEDVEITPAASLTQTGTVEMMDKTGAAWPEANSDPQKMADLALAAHELGDLEAVRVPFGLTVQAEVLGCDIEMGKKDQQPSVETHPYSDDPSELSIPDDFLEKGRIPKIFEAIDILKEEVGDELAIIGGLAGPGTLASHLSGTENFMRWFVTDPDKVEQIMEPSLEACIKYSKALVDNGIDILSVCDPVSSPELLSPDMFDQAIRDALKELSSSVKGNHVLHICGDTTKILESMNETGFAGLSIEEKVNVKKAKKKVEDARIIGTVSTASTILSGSPDEVKEEAKDCLDSGIDVLAPSCGIAPSSPLENIKALKEARDEYYS
ncbi:MAG: Methylcobalamin:coenzyme M methyltransferase MtbA [Candidatus Methanohalarchaeum thermophilum]|uniref:Methylcobalamin:coenzyme M methyltransferase MtbA n=1 Tax=Methanohalarchaeum thermophilum TaxID=1903181 RepID=A0A1Q6DVL0_METT1|nr:MAG: Methylcobalamin:coenzyme M methyltransferase MtbA [Candidatus Methanohalarchaeum thermophilum]